MTETATFGAGCFWGIEAAFRRIPGVVDAVVGYSGGHTENPTYKDVCTDETGHAEVVQVTFDPATLTYEQCRWIESNLHDFGMPGFIGADVFIRGIFSVAAAVPDDGVNNSRNAAECCFDPPKASCAKGRGFGHGTAPLVTLILPGLRTLFDAATSPRDS